MALFLQDDNGRSKLQTRIQSELNDRLRDKPDLDIETPEVDPSFLDGYHQTRAIGVIISLLLIVLVIVALIWALKASGLI